MKHYLNAIYMKHGEYICSTIQIYICVLLFKCHVKDKCVNKRNICHYANTIPKLKLQKIQIWKHCAKHYVKMRTCFL